MISWSARSCVSMTFLVQSEALETEEQILGSNPQRVADLTLEIAELLSSNLKNGELETGCLSGGNADQKIIKYVRQSIELHRQLLEEEPLDSKDISKKKRDLTRALSVLSFHLMSQAVGALDDELAKEQALLEARKTIQECIGQSVPYWCWVITVAVANLIVYIILLVITPWAISGFNYSVVIVSCDSSSYRLCCLFVLVLVLVVVWP